jgi:hypothetical protein
LVFISVFHLWVSHRQTTEAHTAKPSRLIGLRAPMNKTTKQAMIRRVASAHLAKAELSIWGFLDRSGFDKARKELAKVRDMDTIQLLDDATRKVTNALDIPRNEHIALMRLQMLTARPNVGAENLKKQIQNIARTLGIK